MARPAILSIQSQVVAGHVGNGAAAFALQRLGFEAWALPTVLFSNHPGHGRFTGRPTEPTILADLLDGLDGGGWLDQCGAVLTGYLGTAATGAVALDAAARVRARRPDALVAVDPVMGDAPDGLYVRPELVGFFRERAAPAADVMTPNRFELETLTGQAVGTLDEALQAADALRARGPRIVLCTSLDRAERPAGTVETLAVAPDGAWLARSPALDDPPNGAGDLLSALFLAHLLDRRAVPEALGHAVAATWRVLAASVAAGAIELALVPAQDRLIGGMAEATLARVR